METVGDADFGLKLSIIGDSSVGKTNLLKQYFYEEFKQKEIPTVGLDFYTKSITLEDKKIQIQMTDTAGQEKYLSITK